MTALSANDRAAIARTALSTAELEAFTAWHLDQPDQHLLWDGIQDACRAELSDCQAAIAAGVA